MTTTIEPGRLLALVDALAGRRIAVVGDLIADEFIYGEIARVSREAPVLILNYDSTEVVPGGAGNAAGNVASLGGDALIAGLVGRDEAGRRLLSTLKRHRVDAQHVMRPPLDTRRRPKRGFSPAASIRRSNRSSASIAPRRISNVTTRSARRLRRTSNARSAAPTPSSCPTTAAG